MTIQAVREDLNEIRYYFARKKQLDDASIVIGNNKVVDMVNRYHCAMQSAPVKLYDVYASLYVENNTQESLADKWCYSREYIARLNKKLYQYLASAL
ncbi:MAG: hypothetical protein ACI30B_00145 [Paludibacteraceae bacterium]